MVRDARFAVKVKLSTMFFFEDELKDSRDLLRNDFLKQKNVLKSFGKLFRGGSSQKSERNLSANLVRKILKVNRIEIVIMYEACWFKVEPLLELISQGNKQTSYKNSFLRQHYLLSIINDGANYNYKENKI
jgi:hypothetical protein